MGAGSKSFAKDLLHFFNFIFKECSYIIGGEKLCVPDNFSAEQRKHMLKYPFTSSSPAAPRPTILTIHNILYMYTQPYVI